MSSGAIRRHLAQLWQIPLLIVSLALFVGAAWMLIGMRDGISAQQKIQLARTYLRTDRPQAAVEQLNHVLAGRLEREDEAIAHLVLGEAIEKLTAQQKIDVPDNYQRIIEQTDIALDQGIKPTGEIYRRLGESLVMLGRTPAAIARYRQAMLIDPGHSVAMLRRIVDLEIQQHDSAGAKNSLDQFLARRDVADSERAWALVEKADVLIAGGEFYEARSLVRDAARLDDNPQTQGSANVRLAQSALALGSLADAERCARMAREQLPPVHPDHATAAMVLGQSLREQKNYVAAAECYSKLLKDCPDSPQVCMALLGRAICRTQSSERPEAAADLREIMKRAKQDDSELLSALAASETVFAATGDHGSLVEMFTCMQSLQSHLPAELAARLAGALQKRLDQLIAKKAAPDQIRETNARLARAWLAHAATRAPGETSAAHDALCAAVDAAARSGDVTPAAAAADAFATSHANDSVAADVLRHLADAQPIDAAKATRERLLKTFATTPAAAKAAIALAASADAIIAEKFLTSVDSHAAETDQAQALFMLAELYARTGRDAVAIARLEQFQQHWPRDARVVEALFLQAECHRKLAAAPPAQLASARVGDGADPVAATKQHLLAAKKLFDEIIARDGTNSVRDADRNCIKLAHFRRADCLYDLSQFADALPLYQAAATRYQGDTAALAAFVQIVNCDCALGKIEDAKAANTQAKDLMAKLPASAFTDGGFVMPKAYWQQWLKWTSQNP